MSFPKYSETDMIEKLKSWLKAHPPEQIPYWPGAVYTTPFGLRNTQAEIDDPNCSPGHLATDRARGRTQNILMQFAGSVKWRLTGGATGSLGQITADDILMEIQVFHAELKFSLDDHYLTGDSIPIYPGNLGTVSHGRHVHTEILMPYDPGIAAWIRGQSVRVDTDEYIREHCERYRLRDPAAIRADLGRQIESWGITELWDHFAVRRGEKMPDYRIPFFGRMDTMIIDSQWLLKI